MSALEFLDRTGSSPEFPQYIRQKLRRTRRDRVSNLQDLDRLHQPLYRGPTSRGPRKAAVTSVGCFSLTMPWRCLLAGANNLVHEQGRLLITASSMAARKTSYSDSDCVKTRMDRRMRSRPLRTTGAMLASRDYHAGSVEPPYLACTFCFPTGW